MSFSLYEHFLTCLWRLSRGISRRKTKTAKKHLLKVIASLGQMCRAEVLANSCLQVGGKSYQTCLQIYWRATAFKWYGEMTFNCKLGCSPAHTTKHTVNTTQPFQQSKVLASFKLDVIRKASSISRVSRALQFALLCFNVRSLLSCHNHFFYRHFS